ncbi:Uncharacterised protein [Mycobacteroides abscessus]|nr:Uncharacterised protein [Mycobacteroides abscessus]
MSTARRCECPIASIRWCRCMRSGWNGDLPRATRRTTAMAMSSSGRRITASGRRSGMNAGICCAPESVVVSTRPVTTIAAAENTRPRTIEPESPMKIRAGWKLCGRNPTQMPTRAAMTRVARLE